MTTWKEAYERLCSGKDDTCNAIIAWLVSAGWKPDRIIKNSVTKIYGPNQAELWLYINMDTRQYRLEGEYISEGKNALALCSGLLMDPNPSSATLDATMSAFLKKAERAIQSSFAMRFLS
ncbi:hypothetical protein [Thauera sp. WH-1]|uniref:hypothetical protein n=1 Tax=Thauera sp. WH-1 TaxID=3398230 RepID=UPI0039FCE998